jgi:transcriptional regulator with XRE-family HTH domain
MYNYQKVKDIALKHVTKNGVKVTQVEVAKALGTSVSILFGKNPTAKTIEKIVEYFDIDYSDLFTTQKKPKPRSDLPTNQNPELTELLHEIIKMKDELIQKQNDLIVLQKEVGELKLENDRLKVYSSNIAQGKSANVG